jgi:hypothetical protein
VQISCPEVEAVFPLNSNYVNRIRLLLKHLSVGVKVLSLELDGELVRR